MPTIVLFAPGLPIREVKQVGDRYVARLASQNISEQWLEYAGFKWSRADKAWWTTNDPKVIEKRLIEWKQKEASQSAASLPLAVQLRSILASRSGTERSSGSANRERDAITIGPGWVYILSSKAHPHLVKIGFTTDPPESRAAEIGRSTGVPFPFIVEFKIYVEECAGIEAAVHHDLKDSRRNLRREFFEISIADAAKTITKLAVERSASSSTLIAFLREEGKLHRISRG
jgi:hypothetical protein